MRLLSLDDMQRVLDGGEPFLLVDARPASATGRSEPGAAHIPFGEDFVAQVRGVAAHLTLPIVVCCHGAQCPVAEEAAAALRDAGFAEVWTYGGDPRALKQRVPRLIVGRKPVVSDPDSEWRNPHTRQSALQEAY